MRSETTGKTPANDAGRSRTTICARTGVTGRSRPNSAPTGFDQLPVQRTTCPAEIVVAAAERDPPAVALFLGPGDGAVIAQVRAEMLGLDAVSRNGHQRAGVAALRLVGDQRHVIGLHRRDNRLEFRGRQQRDIDAQRLVHGDDVAQGLLVGVVHQHGIAALDEAAGQPDLVGKVLVALVGFQRQRHQRGDAVMRPDDGPGAGRRLHARLRLALRQRHPRALAGQVVRRRAAHQAAADDENICG